MRHCAFAVVAVVCALAFASPASAVTCANGVYRAGCAGPNGAVVVHKPYVAAPRVHYHSAHRPVTCANGVYRAGCVGPSSAPKVIRKPY